MEKRIQIINDDTVLEITETKVVTTRHSHKRLVEERERIEAMIDLSKSRLSEVNSLLASIEHEKDKSR